MCFLELSTDFFFYNLLYLLYLLRGLEALEKPTIFKPNCDFYVAYYDFYVAYYDFYVVLLRLLRSAIHRRNCDVFVVIKKSRNYDVFVVKMLKIAH